MTDAEINIAIAEACGWWVNKPLSIWRHKTKHGRPPSYTIDLNAMYEAERTLNRIQRRNHGEHLQDITKYWCVGIVPDYPRDCENLSHISSASSLQRAEAFLRTIGKWKDS